MYQLPDSANAWEYENAFYLTCDKTRMSKVLAQYDLFRMTLDLPGAIAEFGVFKGASLSRFAIFRNLFGNNFSKKIIGFDIFGTFPKTSHADDKKILESFLAGAGDQSISRCDMHKALEQRGLAENVELIEGDITETLPKYLADNPQTRFSLINLDVDIFEPATIILEQCWDRLVPGGILILDDFGAFAGETKAADTFFKGSVTIRKFPYAMSPCYVVKETK